MQPKLRLAYITTSYPAVSHTFIEREVAALRRLDVEIHTISLRRTSGEHLLTPENRDASESTFAVRPPRWRGVLGAHLSALIGHPLAYLATVKEALSLARPGPRGLLWQIFYFGEAIVVWRHCWEHELRHIHAHHGSPPADVALLAAHYGGLAGSGPRTWSLTMHGPVEFADVRWFNIAAKIQRAQVVVCISDFARSQLMTFLDESQWEKLRVVHCGVNAAEYEHRDAPFAARPRILCVGRLVAEKGHMVLLRALALLGEEGVDVEVELVGSGPMRARLERLALELGVADRVVFRGALGREEVARCYARASLFCSPSFAEGLPMVLMEAMAAGCPVVATAIAGVPELVRDGETGMLVTPGRADELCNTIATLIDDEPLRSRLAGAGREHVRREFDIDQSGARLRVLFAQALVPADRLPRGTASGGGWPADVAPSGEIASELAALAPESSEERLATVISSA
jgi:colanic acid/amylovoran biosynthesis glycosyltransferase